MLVNFINMYNRRFSGQPLTVSCTLFTYLVIDTCLFALSLAIPLCIGDVATSRELCVTVACVQQGVKVPSGCVDFL